MRQADIASVLFLSKYKFVSAVEKEIVFGEPNESIAASACFGIAFQFRFLRSNRFVSSNLFRVNSLES